jgi:hypothetical protein
VKASEEGPSHRLHRRHSVADTLGGGNCRNSANRFTAAEINDLGELNLQRDDLKPVYLQAKFGVVAALLAGILSALAVMLTSGHVTHPSESQMREALERELDRFASMEATMCGLVLRLEDRSDAISCAMESIAAKRPFLVAFQERGEDSDIWSGLVGNPQGEMQLLLLDSSPHGQPQVRAEYFVTSHECQEPVFSDTGNGAVRCLDHDMQ